MMKMIETAVRAGHATQRTHKVFVVTQIGGKNQSDHLLPHFLAGDGIKHGKHVEARIGHQDKRSGT